MFGAGRPPASEQGEPPPNPAPDHPSTSVFPERAVNWRKLVPNLARDQKDDATNEIYYAQLVEQESTRTVMAAIRHMVQTKGWWFSSLYSDRASHFFRTPKAGERVDTRQLTEVGRALKDVGIEPIPAYSPQARGRSERNFGTWQGRLPQELRHP